MTKKKITNKKTKKIILKKQDKEIEKESIKSILSKRLSMYLFIVVSLLSLSLFIGLSYAVYQVDETQSQANEIEVGCFTINFVDSGTNNTYTNLSLTNSYPITTQTALSKTPYTFQITNTCDYIARTNIAINVLNTSSISQLAQSQNKEIGDMISVAIKEGNNAVSTPVILSSLEEGTIRANDTVTDVSYILKTEYLEKNQPKTYSIWMWVPSEINGVVVGNEAEGLTLYSKVDVYSQAISDDEVPVPAPTVYQDDSGAAYPELYEGMIPVKYNSNGDTVVADLSEEWYDYDEHEWANAVLVTSAARNKEAGETLSDSEILQYYVWIPRYKYQLWNAENGSSNEQMIEIEFQDKEDIKATGSTNGTWLTHPAFTFGSTELNGVWVGKFETSHTTLSNHTNANELNCSNENCANGTGLRILPNKVSLVYDNISNQFYASRSIESQSVFGLDSTKIDTHMMKNMEWGAVAYLSSSKYGRYIDSSTCISSGCEVWINNTHVGSGCVSPWGVSQCGGTITGCSSKISKSDSAQHNMNNCGGTDYEWNGAINNGRSSTTGNIYGIYDMSGGGYDALMGNASTSTTEYVYNERLSGLSEPNDIYMDKYINSIDSSTNFVIGKLGDATKEVIKTQNTNYGSWYGDVSNIIVSNSPWFYRGGKFDKESGIFGFDYAGGTNNASASFRVVLTKE